MNAFNAVDAFIYEHGFTLYIVFLNLSMVALGFILANHTFRSHPPLDDAPRPPCIPRRPPGQPPILPPPRRQNISIPRK